MLTSAQVRPYLLAAVTVLVIWRMYIRVGMYALRHTKFEGSSLGYLYTPHTHVGIALALLLIGRAAYKLVHKDMLTSGDTQSPTEIVKSPLTLFIVGTLAGYFATYAFGLLGWRRTGVAPAIAPNTPSSEA